MKRQFGKTLQHIAALTLGVFLVLSSVAEAATNTGTGDVAGDAAALGNSNAFDLSSASALTLVKTAFLTVGGAQLSTTDTVPAGTSVDFMIFLNNESSVQVDDVTIQDILNVAFTYQGTTIKIDNSVVDCGADCDATERQAVYDAAILTTALSDAVDTGPGDAGSYSAPNIDVGNGNVANDQLDALGNRVLALVFTVVVP